MKKSYIAPVCEIVKLNTADIIATSLTTPGREFNGEDVNYGRDSWFDDEW